MDRIRKFLSDTSAATSVEYAVMLALILIAVIGAVPHWAKHRQQLQQHELEDAGRRLWDLSQVR